MPTSVAGSKPSTSNTHPQPAKRPLRQAGFTLVELLVVLLIVALASGGVTLALRDSQAQQLEREAQRLVAWLEAGRAQARASASAIHWRSRADGFEFVGAGLRPNQRYTLLRPQTWLQPGVQARIVAPPQAQTLQLGPEAILPAQTLELRLGEHSLRIGSSGLAPFAVLDPTVPAPAGTRQP